MAVNDHDVTPVKQKSVRKLLLASCVTRSRLVLCTVSFTQGTMVRSQPASNVICAFIAIHKYLPYIPQQLTHNNNNIISISIIIFNQTVTHQNLQHSNREKNYTYTHTHTHIAVMCKNDN